MAPSAGSDTTLDVGLAEDVLTDGRATVTLGPDGRSVLIVKTFKGVFAMDDHCPHRGFPLHTAPIRGRHITCPLHDLQYDMRTGTCRTRASRNRPLTLYRAWIANGHLYLSTTSQRLNDPEGENHRVKP